MKAHPVGGTCSLFEFDDPAPIFIVYIPWSNFRAQLRDTSRSGLGILQAWAID